MRLDCGAPVSARRDSLPFLCFEIAKGDPSVGVVVGPGFSGGASSGVAWRAGGRVTLNDVQRFTLAYLDNHGGKSAHDVAHELTQAEVAQNPVWVEMNAQLLLLNAKH